MEGTTLLGRLNWQFGEVIAKKVETPRAASITLAVPQWSGHIAGQHVDVRLTAEDGYQTERSYSIASAPAKGQLTLTIERLDDGEVSPYLADELLVGDKVELRGPIGGYFVWDTTNTTVGGPLMLVAGGSGIVPLMSMIREWDATASSVPVRLLYSVRSYEEIIYREELDALAQRKTALQIFYTLTRMQPEHWSGYRRRVDSAILHEVSWSVQENPLAYICGPTLFVETVAQGFLSLNYKPEHIKTERFGPTGS